MISRLLNIPYTEILEMRSEEYFHCAAALEAAMNEVNPDREDAFDLMEVLGIIKRTKSQPRESRKIGKEELREKHKELHEDLIHHEDLPDTPATDKLKDDSRDSLLD